MVRQASEKLMQLRKLSIILRRNILVKTAIFSLVEAENRVRTIMFHQSCSYEEFIEGIRPILNNREIAGISYRL